MAKRERKITIYGTADCEPCDELKEAVAEGNYTVITDKGESQPKIKFVDLSEDEEYPQVEAQGINELPSARRGKDFCAISFDNKTNKLTIDCTADADEE